MPTKKVVVITGASGGIGAALAEKLGSQGHRLVLAARREPELRQVAKRSAPEALVVPTDVTRRAEVERLSHQAVEAFGHVDVWVNNAGRGSTRQVSELTDEDFDQMMTVNVKSALYGIQAILPHFKQRQEGHILNVSSFLGRVPLAPFRSAYNASKAALNSLTANLRMELRSDYPRIHVSLVMPGPVATDFARNAAGTASVPAGAAAGTRVQSAAEVAEAMAALILNPVAEILTNPDQPAQVTRYFQDVEAFENSLLRR